MGIEIRDTWILKLKAGFDAGYYRTESSEALQSHFPWQNKTCRDCPFWRNEICRVRAIRQAGELHTCKYFDPPNHAAAQRMIDTRMAEVRKKRDASG